MMLAAMFLIDTGTKKAILTGGVTAWTIESVQRSFGQQGPLGVEIARYWSMGLQQIKDVAGGWVMEII
jgi:hypothetical protein